MISLLVISLVNSVFGIHHMKHVFVLSYCMCVCVSFLSSLSLHLDAVVAHPLISQQQFLSAMGIETRVRSLLEHAETQDEQQVCVM